MNRIALLVIVLAAGCSNQKPEERKLPGAAAPASPAPTAPGTGSAGTGSAGSGSAGSAAAGSAAPAADAKTGFAPFDEALAGARPWIAADDKAGVVELYAIDDPSDRTKGRFSVDLRCGADAAKAVETVAKQIPERAKSGHEPPKCKEDAGVTSCRQPGLAEGDFQLEILYGKSGDAWRAIGVKTTGVGVTATKEETKYAELLKQKCK
jgi:hypothetical protein